jgi:hypothetical protein
VGFGVETGVHDGEVLIGKGQVHHDIRFETVDKRDEFAHIVGVYLGGADDGFTAV